MVEEYSDLQELDGGLREQTRRRCTRKGLRSKVLWGVGPIIQILRPRPNTKELTRSQQGGLFRGAHHRRLNRQGHRPRLVEKLSNLSSSEQRRPYVRLLARCGTSEIYSLGTRSGGSLVKVVRVGRRSRGFSKMCYSPAWQPAKSNEGGS